MEAKRIEINNIPAILWGQISDRLYIHVHGKMSCKEHAQAFAQIAQSKGYQTISFDLPEHGERKGSNDRCDIWSGMNDLEAIGDYAFSNWSDLSLFACSMGAYFSLNTYGKMKFTKCLFQSPILDMEYLIRQMFLWFNVTEERLRAEKEIPTPIDPLRWDYFRYAVEHPVKGWEIPTHILYGGKDNLQSIAVVKDFALEHSCKLTVSQNSEHPFMQEGDQGIVSAWLEENI